MTVDEFAWFCQDAIPPESADPSRVDSSLFKAQTGSLNLGYLVNRICWTDIQIRLDDVTEHSVHLEHGQTQADVIRVFHSLDGLSWMDLGMAGNNVPASQWPVHYRAPTFAVKLQPGLNRLRIYQSSRDITGVDWRIWEPRAFYLASNWESMLYGGFFAICLALSLYNLGIFAVSRDPLHLYYCLYLGSYGWVQMFLTGYTKLHILTDVGPFLGRMGITCISASIFFVYLFVGRLLEMPKFPRVMSRLFWFMAWLALSNILITTLGPFDIGAGNCLLGSGVGSILALLYGFYAIKLKNPLAPIFLVAWSLLLIGTVIQVSALGGLIESTPLTRSANFVGATVEAILISYALAFKMKRERIDETRRRKHAYSQLGKMVYPHQLSMMEQGRQLEETMPLATGNACVLCVDMIDSSKQNIHELKHFLRCFFDECDAVMKRGYVGEGLQAYGFRIKEMGDGFLCSVGFPFLPPSHLSLREIALDMAADFVQKFEETLEHFPIQGSSEPLLSIGIAEGPIEGFFTLSGIRSYELFGKGIVLATRYEALRKIHEIPGSGHLICIKSTVYQALPAQYQKAFTRFVLDKSRQYIRDDEAVKDFHFQRIASRRRHAASA
ncbi:7TM diverse intracellular signaling domain-containing protein [Oligoflexus tunisiensis]|uniref:7TM diverse intracellular signaling domain-containing protein n=1 Tax=Oligoflexus tunisiensis TaxID=708132 RepID=UPI001FE1763F|nr:7TM diverse intracellular signaling domain-containing protein [Oligoflexus tunisiensis]